jgi:hypothetical protein
LFAVAVIRANNPSASCGQAPGVNFMGGIHPRLKRPVGHRLAVAAAALLHPEKSGGAPFMTGPTISGCSYSAGSLTLKFNKTLLGSDTIAVQDFDTNMSNWNGVDSLTAMVCGSAAAPPPGPPMTCQEKCEAAGHCAVGLISCGQSPSCGQGCEVAAAGAALDECKATCNTAGGDGKGGAGCTHKYKNLTLQSCANCATWLPTQRKPAGLSPYANCGQNSIGHCIEGCEYAHGAAPRPLFPSVSSPAILSVACDFQACSERLFVLGERDYLRLPELEQGCLRWWREGTER